MRILLSLLLLLCAFPAEAPARTLTLGTWNLDNLSATAGQALRNRAPKRTEADYARLAYYAGRLDADIAALQEVGSPKAVARLFPPKDYAVVFSGRYASNQRAQRDIFNALVLKKSSVRLLRQEDVPELAFGSFAGGHWTRFGVAALVAVERTRFWILNVHLKSGCHNKSLRRPRRPACKTLSRQRQVLARWIAAKRAQGLPFLLLGDFNRRINVYGARDHLWQALTAAGTPLVRFPSHGRQLCPRHAGDEFIDFFVLGSRTAESVIPESFEEIVYKTKDRRQLRGLSDHCPLRLRLNIP